MPSISQHSLSEGMSRMDFGGNTSPIGVFDSGYGGLTVLRAIKDKLPNENLLFVGDSQRCPYGPRELSEVRGFVLDICEHFVQAGCKLIVLACNTATAAGLTEAQRTFDIPIVGVVEPGARAAVRMTNNRRVGVIATQGTVDSQAYVNAIHNLDAGIKVYQAACPRFVEIVEQGIQVADERELSSWNANQIDLFCSDTVQSIADDYLLPLKQEGIDTLVLGCTHYPLIAGLIANSVGDRIKLVSSATEAALDVSEILALKGASAPADNQAWYRFATTSDDLAEFARFGASILGMPMQDVRHMRF